MFRRRVVAVAVLAGAMVALPLSSAGAEAPLTPADLTCDGPTRGPNIDSTKVLLTHDLSCFAGAEIDIGPFVGGPGVTADLGGHTLTFTGGSNVALCYLENQCSLIVRSGGSSLRNGTIRGGSVELSDGDDRIEHLVTIGTVDVMRRGLWTKSVVIGGTIYLDDGTLTRSVVAGSSGLRVLDIERGVDATITDNLFLNGGGIAVTPGTAGIFANDVAGTVERNILWGTSGIYVAGDARAFQALQVSHNLVVHSTGAGISANVPDAGHYSPTAFVGTVTLTGNMALFNQQHGIDASPVAVPPSAVVDGGHNFAFGNAVQPQCVGVHCFP
jgi:hypothetical protein